MPYRPRPSRYPGSIPAIRSDRAEQAYRYDRLAHFVWHVSTVHGRHQYSFAAIRRSLAASHVLNKDGTVRQERLQRWTDSRGIKAKFTDDPAKWESILIGESPSYAYGVGLQQDLVEMRAEQGRLPL
jgi:hypothetical protein